MWCPQCTGSEYRLGNPSKALVHYSDTSRIIYCVVTRLGWYTIWLATIRPGSVRMFCTGEILRNSRHWSVRQAVWHQLNLSSVRMVWEDMVFITYHSGLLLRLFHPKLAHNCRDGNMEKGSVPCTELGRPTSYFIQTRPYHLRKALKSASWQLTRLGCSSDWEDEIEKVCGEFGHSLG